MADTEHPRLILYNFLTQDQCKELEFIQKSCSTVGYRSNVFSTTLSHLIATNCAHLIMPLVPIRERLKEKVEEYFGCEFELYVEFTGLISWNRGASIGWHSDDNRPYLKQRDFAVVCYLNNYGKDFEGGLFHFQDGEPQTIIPSTGDVVMYTADDRNIHSVDEITSGERMTLTMWFTRDASHDEDAELLSFLSRCLLDDPNNTLESRLPVPAPSNMYWYSLDPSSLEQSGIDIRCARMHIFGYDILFSQDENCASDISELQELPVQLTRGDELFELEFGNILHALQVLQFYCWKASHLEKVNPKGDAHKVVKLLQQQRESISSHKSMFLRDLQMAEAVFGSRVFREPWKHCFDWSSFPVVTSAWEDYTSKLCKQMFASLPCWKAHQSIFSVPIDES